MSDETTEVVATEEVQPQEAHADTGTEDTVASESDKFKGDYGKLQKSYSEVEAYSRRLANELHQVKSSLESMKSKIAPVDPDKMFEEKVKKSPYEAVRSVAEESDTFIRQKIDAVELRLAMQEMRNTYPDFDELRPFMGDLFGQYGHLINPNNPNDPAYLEFLYLKARELKKGDLVKRAKDAGKREEKAASSRKASAFMEGSSKATDIGDFEKLSLDEMEKQLLKKD